MGDYEHMDTETLRLASDPATPTERLHEIACAGLKSSPFVLQSLCQHVAQNWNTSVETLAYLAANTYNTGILNDPQSGTLNQPAPHVYAQAPVDSLKGGKEGRRPSTGSVAVDESGSAGRRPHRAAKQAADRIDQLSSHSACTSQAASSICFTVILASDLSSETRAATSCPPYTQSIVGPSVLNADTLASAVIQVGRDASCGCGGLAIASTMRATNRTPIGDSSSIRRLTASRSLTTPSDVR